MVDRQAMNWNLPESIIESWLADCRLAISSPEAFATFRQMPHVTYITENWHAHHVDELWGSAKSIYPGIARRLPEISASDALGGSAASDVATVDGYPLSGCAAHAALRAAQIVSLFGRGPFDIAEIGGGYGCLANVLNHVGLVRSYIGFDLPDPAALQQRYLTAQGWLGEWPQAGEIPRDRYDLCISIYSISELNEIARDDYAERVLRRSRRGFHVWNWGREYWYAPSDAEKVREWLSVISSAVIQGPHGPGMWKGVFAWGGDKSP